jgi:F-type H+-transporting ATPase subunit delta
MPSVDKIEANTSIRILCIDSLRKEIIVASSDVQTYAQALHETIVDAVLEQLRAAMPAIEGVDPNAEDVQHQINSALPEHTLPQVRNFLSLLAQEGALDRLPRIVGTFERYGERGEQARDAHVTSAFELNDGQREHIVRQLNERYQADLDVSFSVDETLIGGLIIRVGDQVLDNSIRTRLSAVQRSMMIG